MKWPCKRCLRSQGSSAAAGVDVFEAEPPVNMDFLYSETMCRYRPHIGAASTSEAQQPESEKSWLSKIIDFFQISCANP